MANRPGLGRLYFSLNCRQTPIGLTTLLYFCPSACTHHKWQYRLQLLLFQLAAADDFSRVSAVFKVLGKCFNIPIKREFLQIPRTNQYHNKAEPPARQLGWGGAGLQASVWPPLLGDDTAPHRAERSRAHIFNNLPLAKIGRGETGFGFNVLHFQIYNATSYYFLTILKE